MAYIGTSPSQGVRHRYLFTATSGQTTFSGADDDSRTLSYTDTKFMDVFLNGVLLDPNSDYTATTGTSVVLTSGASAGDLLEVIAFDSFSVFSGAFGGDVTVSGDLLVGKTSSASQTTTVGHSIESDGRLYATRSGGAPLQLSRLSTDGNIASFYKDGAVVGSIGTSGGELYINFGGSVSGDVTSRTLDDYEEGTWTPTLGGTISNPTSVSYVSGFRVGTYVKIGKLVYCTYMMDVSSISGGSGSAVIGGLPYTIENSNASYGNQALLIDNLDFDNKQVSVQPQANGDYALIVRYGGGTGGHSGLDITTFNSATSAIRGTIIYRAS